MPHSLVSAFGLVFWSQSVITEVYTLHAMLFAALLRVIFQWRATGEDRWLRVGSVIAGLGMSNHHLLGLSEAFCCQWVAATGRPVDPRRFHVYAAMAAVKLGAAMVRHLRPGWDQLAVNCVREAESHLQQLGAAVTEVTA